MCTLRQDITSDTSNALGIRDAILCMHVDILSLFIKLKFLFCDSSVTRLINPREKLLSLTMEKRYSCLLLLQLDL